MTSSALVSRRFSLYCKEPDIFFAAIRSLKVHGSRQGLYRCKPPERLDDHKLAYYINMGYPIRADQCKEGGSSVSKRRVYGSRSSIQSPSCLSIRWLPPAHSYVLDSREAMAGPREPTRMVL